MTIITPDNFDQYQGSYPNFTFNELCCSETGELAIPLQTLMELQTLRSCLGFPIILNSAYRSPRHSIEVAKGKRSLASGAKPYGGGPHTKGAFDIRATSSERAYNIVYYATTSLYWNGLGINMTGDWSQRFIHIDNRPITERAIWSY